MAHGLSCSTACGIFPDKGLNPCPLHWQADSQPLRHQGSPLLCILDNIYSGSDFCSIISPLRKAFPYLPDRSSPSREHSQSTPCLSITALIIMDLWGSLITWLYSMRARAVSLFAHHYVAAPSTVTTHIVGAH